MTSAEQALDRLRAGNARFIAEGWSGQAATSAERRNELTAGQAPFAIILGCSDSRVPAEIVFDAGLGDLFVIRVAGNIVAPSQIASVEFAADKFGTQLVVVLGHSNCGAVEATLEELALLPERRSPNLRAIVDRIQPSVDAVLEQAHRLDAGELMRLTVRENIRASADQLRHGSDVLERLIREEDLRIVAAEYCLETGAVDFFEGC